MLFLEASTNLIVNFSVTVDLVSKDCPRTMTICGICNIKESKYKCPKCSVNYCSIGCFKDVGHTHQSNEENQKVEDEKKEVLLKAELTSKFDKVINDSQIQSMLKYKSLQFHLSVILKIINDASITGESVLDDRKEIANLKLTNLRSGGLEQNELVEGFVERVLFLLNED